MTEKKSNNYDPEVVKINWMKSKTEVIVATSQIAVTGRIHAISTFEITMVPSFPEGEEKIYEPIVMQKSNILFIMKKSLHEKLMRPMKND